jgi:hypothetical protein
VTIAALVRGDIDAAVAYAECAARHASVVAAYDAARQDAVDWNAGKGQKPVR